MKLHRATLGRREWWQGALLVLAFVFVSAPAFAAASVTVSIDAKTLPAYTMSVENVYTVELLVANGKVSQPIPFPKVDGLPVTGSGFDPHRNAFTFFVTPKRPGDFMVPAFEFRTDDGQTLHVGPIKVHVTAQ